LPDKEYKTVGKLAVATGCNKETIRYYEKIGLMIPPARSEGGHRLYEDSAKKRLVFIRRSRELGFTLAQIRELLALVDGHKYTCAQVNNITLEQAQTIRAKINDLKKMEESLIEMAKNCSAKKVPECAIISALYSDKDKQG
jgi:MerR family mercuric resistance operon transcriptional regulator